MMSQGYNQLSPDGEISTDPVIQFLKPINTIKEKKKGQCL